MKEICNEFTLILLKGVKDRGLERGVTGHSVQQAALVDMDVVTVMRVINVRVDWYVELTTAETSIHVHIVWQIVVSKKVSIVDLLTCNTNFD